MPTDVPSNAPFAFFSYCRADSDFALKLAGDLKATGANVWIDQLDIEFGTPWDRAVEDALQNASRMLVILSPASAVSDNVRDEIARALRQQKRIIPVLYRDCEVPIQLERLQRIDFRTDYALGLRFLLKWLGVATQPPAPAEVAAEKAKAEEAELDGHAGLADAERQTAATEKIHPQPGPPFQQIPVAPPTGFAAWAKLAAGVGAAAFVIWLLYAALSPPKQSTSGNQQPGTQAQQTQPTTQPPSAGTTAGSVPPGLSADIADEYRKAQSGDVGAMVDVALAYANGQGAPKDDSQAFYWDRKAAEAGNAWGMNNLAIDYLDGLGTKKDEIQAATWFRKAADGGNTNAMASLGAMYRHGRGVPQDDKQAVYWYRKAAEAGGALGMNNLGGMYEDGLGGLPRNRQKALEWYRKAAQLGNQLAKDNLKRLSENPP